MQIDSLRSLDSPKNKKHNNKKKQKENNKLKNPKKLKISSLSEKSFEEDKQNNREPSCSSRDSNNSQSRSENENGLKIEDLKLKNKNPSILDNNTRKNNVACKKLYKSPDVNIFTYQMIKFFI